MVSTVKRGKTIDQCVEQALKEIGATIDQVDIDVIQQPKNGFLGIIGAKDAIVRVSLKEEYENQQSRDIVKEILHSKKVEPKKEEPKKEEQKKEVKNKTIPDQKSKEKTTASDVTKKEPKIEKKPVEKKAPITADREKGQTDEPTNLGADQSTDEVISTSKAFLAQILTDMGLPCDIETIRQEHGVKFNLIAKDTNDVGIIIGKQGETLDSIQYLVNLIANRNASKYQRVMIDINNYRNKRMNSLEKLARNSAFRVRKSKKPVYLESMNPYERRIIHAALQKEKNIITVSEGEDPNRRVIIKYDKKL